MTAGKRPMASSRFGTALRVARAYRQRHSTRGDKAVKTGLLAALGVLRIQQP